MKRYFIAIMRSEILSKELSSDLKGVKVHWGKAFPVEMTSRA